MKRTNQYIEDINMFLKEPEWFIQRRLKRGGTRNLPRDLEIAKLYCTSDLTYEEVGNKYGITRERTRQVVIKCLRMFRYDNRFGREV